MTLPVEVNPILLESAGGYQISRSLRFRSSASAILSRTPTVAGNRRTWTFSAWMKRATITPANSVFFFGSNWNASTGFTLYWGTTDAIGFAINGVGANETTAKFRDPSAWYHVVFALDTTQATQTNRAKVYINGVQQTFASFTLLGTQNAQYDVNNVTQHELGKNNGGLQYFDGYMADVYLIDGQALTPSSFGMTDPITGVWEPIKYSGTYGTNGFYLNFADNSGATATTIGKDSSGNGNNYTPSGISVTAGVTYDSMIDVPTPYADGGNGRGNYATLNPIGFYGSTQAGVNPVSNPGYGNLLFNTDQPQASAPATIFVTSGKWYAEFVPSTSNAVCGIGVGSTASTAAYFPNTSGSGFAYQSGGTVVGNSGTIASALSTYTLNDVIGVALDMDAKSVAWYKNNVLVYTQSTGFSTDPYTFFCGDSSTTAGQGMNANFGQRPFTYTPPSGFKALNTQNLPSPSIVYGNRYFDINLRTGTSATVNVTGKAFQPDLVWVKARSTTTSHKLTDSVRGVTKALSSDLLNAEATDTAGLTAFSSTGYTIGSDANYNNATGPITYVDWFWKKGAVPGFDVVPITFAAGGTQNVSHSLGVKPNLIIVKSRSVATQSWVVYHSVLGATQILFLNLNNAAAANSTAWNNTEPTSSVFTLGSGFTTAAYGTSGIAYLFAEVPGFSSFGTFTGNGSTDGSFSYCGFRPAFVSIKRTDTLGNWNTYDSARNTYNPASLQLQLSSNIAEGANDVDFVSNGFKQRSTGTGLNASGGTYVYMAFAENPFKYALAR